MLNFKLILERVLDITDKVTLVFGAVAVAILLMVTVGDVAGRYVFNHPLVGAYEVTQLLMVAIVFTGIAAVQAAGGHIRVEILVKNIKGRRFRAATEVLALACGIIAFGLIGWEGWEDFLRAWLTQDYTMGLIEFPTWPAKIWIPIGSALICLRLILQISQEIGESITNGTSNDKRLT